MTNNLVTKEMIKEINHKVKEITRSSLCEPTVSVAKFLLLCGFDFKHMKIVLRKITAGQFLLKIENHDAGNGKLPVTHNFQSHSISKITLSKKSYSDTLPKESGTQSTHCQAVPTWHNNYRYIVLRQKTAID